MNNKKPMFDVGMVGIAAALAGPAALGMDLGRRPSRQIPEPKRATAIHVDPRKEIKRRRKQRRKQKP